MSIFSSIGKAIGSVASKAVSVVSPVAKTVVGAVTTGLGISGGSQAIPTTVSVQAPNLANSIQVATERATQTVQSSLADTLRVLTERLAPVKPQQEPVNAPAASAGGFSLTPMTMLTIGGVGLGLVFIGGKVLD